MFRRIHRYPTAPLHSDSFEYESMDDPAFVFGWKLNAVQVEVLASHMLKEAEHPEDEWNDEFEDEETTSDERVENERLAFKKLVGLEDLEIPTVILETARDYEARTKIVSFNIVGCIIRVTEDARSFESCYFGQEEDRVMPKLEEVRATLAKTGLDLGEPRWYMIASSIECVLNSEFG